MTAPDHAEGRASEDGGGADGSPPPPIRWIATDLDGTLVSRDAAMVASGRAALRRYMAAGGEVVIATGRSERSAWPYYRELGLTGPAILYNGARTVDLSTGRVLDDHSLSPAAWGGLLGLFGTLRPTVHPVVFSEGEAFAVDDVAPLRAYSRRDGVALRDPGSWEVLARAPITKCMLIGDIAALPPLHVPGVTLVRSEDVYLEALPEGATKGAALRTLAAARGMPLARVAAIGDNPNDTDMIRAAGLGAAVGDGHPDVRAAADLVVSPCAEGAVADLVAVALGDHPDAPGHLPGRLADPLPGSPDPV
jgi:Cof subfamily protein (haloacid dehalogenase superfamily)